MGKKKQKGKALTAEEREGLRLQTDLVGKESQHLATIGTLGNAVRQLHGRSILIPPLPMIPSPSQSQPTQDPVELFNLGIDPPPTDPPCLVPLTPKLTQPIEIET